MDNAIETAQKLADRPDLLPWVAFIVVCATVYANRQVLKDYIISRTESNRESKMQSAILVEVLRNNTAALDNNTAALESVKADRGETRRMLEHHEELSAGRDERTLAIVQRVEARVTDNGEKLSLVEDRTENIRQS